MKAVIWIGCFITMAIIQGGIINSGFILGAVPTILLWIFLMSIVPKCLCKLWDKFKK